MKITKIEQVDQNDRIYTITLSNKSKHLATLPVVFEVSNLPPGELIRLPSGDFINRSHIVEMSFNKEETGKYVRATAELCAKYELPAPEEGTSAYTYQLPKEVFIT